MKKIKMDVVMALALNAVLVLLLLPLLYCSTADVATGDDLLNGAVVYHVLQDGGSMVDVLRAVGAYIVENYRTWQGTWSSIFLFCFAPVNWGRGMYAIVPWIAIFTVLAGAWLLMREFLVKRAQLPVSLFWSLFALTGIFLTQYAPKPRAGFFWYTCVAHYNIPFLIMALTLVGALHFTLDAREGHPVRAGLCYLLLLFGYTYLGGASYPPVLLSLFGTSLLLLILFFRIKGEEKKLCRKRGVMLLLPFLLEMAGLLVSMAAPGNHVRGGSHFGFSVKNIVMAGGEAFLHAITDSLQMFLSIRPLFLLVTSSVVLMLCTYRRGKREFFRHPLLFLLLAYLGNVSVYLPEIFAGAKVSGGYTDLVYFVFIITLVLTTVYLTGFVLEFLLERRGENGLRTESRQRIGLIYGIAVVLFLALFYRHLIGDSMDYICLQYIRSGAMEDFKAQMADWFSVLENPRIKDVVLEPVNDDQGPIKLYLPTEDQDHILNRAVAGYYRKDSVVMKK